MLTKIQIQNFNQASGSKSPAKFSPKTLTKLQPLLELNQHCPIRPKPRPTSTEKAFSSVEVTSVKRQS